MPTIDELIAYFGDPPKRTLSITQELFGEHNGIWGGLVHKHVCWWHAHRLHGGEGPNYLVAPQYRLSDGAIAVKICAHGVNRGTPLAGAVYAARQDELVAVQVHGYGNPRSQ